MSRYRVMMKTAEAVERIHKKGWQMKKAAKKIGISSSYLSDLIYRRRSVSSQMSTSILMILSWRGKTWDDLFEVESYTNGAMGI